MVKDIYLAKIHFTNESGAKIRPVLNSFKRIVDSVCGFIQGK